MENRYSISNTYHTFNALCSISCWARSLPNCTAAEVIAHSVFQASCGLIGMSALRPSYLICLPEQPTKTHTSQASWTIHHNLYECISCCTFSFPAIKLTRGMGSLCRVDRSLHSHSLNPFVRSFEKMVGSRFLHDVPSLVSF